MKMEHNPGGTPAVHPGMQPGMQPAGMGGQVWSCFYPSHLVSTHFIILFGD